MSRFYASIQGNRGMATRQGHKSIEGHIRGWNIGVRVVCFIDKNGNDAVNIFKTSGSNGNKPDELIEVFEKKH